MSMTQEEFIQEAKKVHGDKYNYSKIKYINKTTNVCIVCSEHGEFWQQPYKHLSGRGCFKCGISKIKENLKYTNEEYIEKAQKRYHNKYDYSKVNYINNHTKICVICPEHGEFWVFPQEHLGMLGCPICGETYVGTNKLSNTKEFIEKAKKVHGDKYDYSKVEYINTKTKVCIICPEHGEFWQLPYKHLSGRGCRACSGKLKYTTESFIEKCSKLEHVKNLSFEKVNYVNSNTKIKILCHYKDKNGDEHGEFEINPMKLLSGQGCPKCRYIKSAAGRRRTLEEVINNANEVHNNKYDYSLITSYKNDRVKYPIMCPEHGVFYQTFNNHIKSKQGCSICGRIKSDEQRCYTTDKYIKKCLEVHENKYDYSKVNYISSSNMVDIICPKHGLFKQIARNHLFGQGCPKCFKEKSNIERELFDYIKSLLNQYDVEENNRTILNGKEIDVYIPNLKIGFEMNGLIWHSNKFENDENYHLSKTEECLKQGVRLIHIFEDEWLYKNDICKSIIKNILRLTQNKIYARNCQIRTVSLLETIEFLEKNDIQGEIKTLFNFGLYYNDELVQIICFNKIDNKENVFELSRLCSKLNTVIVGGASRLFKHFISNHSPSKIISFADRRWSIGDVFNKIGFNFLDKIEPQYSYVLSKKRFKKDILYQKGYNDEINEIDFCDKNDIYRIYDCGLLKYVWKNNKI